MSGKSQSAAAKQAVSEQNSITRNITRVARDHFGIDTLRPGQEEAIRALLDGRDTLVVMPTGSGKSAIYQIAASLMRGPALIVSPLIALQKDQVDSINEQNGAAALVVNSALSVSETREAFENIGEGAGKFIFMAPEQLRKEETVEALQQAGISLFVVDEAHCISEWGHDFRPDYLQLGAAIELLGRPTVLAMTATASPRVRGEIVERLNLRNPKVLVRGFDRPNIYLRVDRFENQRDKLQALIHRIRWTDKPGIVYVATRKSAEEIMHLLAEEGIHALYYHGGLKASDRTAIQEEFMSGRAAVIVATNAFGMGIDKSDVRFVYHYDVSESVDAYYQEIGRAGRDGERAEAVLFFRDEDFGVQKFRSGEGKLDAGQIERVADVIAGQEGPVEAEEISEQSGLSQRKLATAIHRLEDVGALEVSPAGELQIADEIDLEKAAEAAAAEQEKRRQAQRERLQQMREYAETSTCRREFLLRYFGDDFTGPCNNCDNCEASDPDARIDPAIGTRREVA